MAKKKEDVPCKNPSCSRTFRRRANKLYCSPSCKFKVWSGKSRVRREVRKLDASHGSFDPCYYCGGPGETTDHAPPWYARERMREEDSPWPYAEVRACKECQGILNHRPPWGLEERRQKVKTQLRLRYASLLAGAEWEDEERNELGPNLRTYIEESKIMREYIEFRLAWDGKKENDE